MNKKIISIGLAILCLLSLVGCNKSTSKGTFEPMIKNLEWGMTESQVVSELKDIEYTQSQGDTDLTNYIELTDPIKKFGYNCTAVLCFSKDLNTNLKDEGILSSIVLQYSDVKKDKLLSELKSCLGDNCKESSVTPGLKSYVWDSKKTMKDIPKDSFNKITSFLSNKAPNTSESALLPTIDDPVNRIIFRIAESDSGSSLTVTYYGQWERVLNYLKNTQVLQ